MGTTAALLIQSSLRWNEPCGCKLSGQSTSAKSVAVKKLAHLHRYRRHHQLNMTHRLYICLGLLKPMVDVTAGQKCDYQRPAQPE